ncbi:ketoacyl-ACP synthase III [Spongiivirga sp. MCCC 1A20706]|uniref:3-oxoacyl-ACP synthase III family protein n=1 Tax=Spongiivirga sp. MCCC 1A20706 TaxID=3160963 RepID=UPI0039772D4E
MMAERYYSVIKGTGSYIPTKRVMNEDFLSHEFYDSSGEKLTKPNQEIIEKFEAITTIQERRYVNDDQTTSDIAFYAAEKAIVDAGIDKESLDYIIVGHNFAEVKNGNNRMEQLPALASRVKHKLGIKNPATVAYDLPFGCPGWVQGMIQADYYIRSGDAKRCLVIGADVLSRVCDPHDRDSMIYADGAGATILEAYNGEKPKGILAHGTRSDTVEHAHMLFMGPSYKKDTGKPDNIYLKMFGRKLYQYALENVPTAIKACLEKSNTHLSEIKKILIHQANGKMDEAILKRLYKLYDIPVVSEEIMPMTIEKFGNSSTATVPTLLDLILNGKVEGHAINTGDKIVLASVGAGMNINAIVYQM